MFIVIEYINGPAIRAKASCYTLKSLKSKNPEDLRKRKNCLEYLSNNQDKSTFQIFRNETQKCLFPRFF